MRLVGTFCISGISTAYAEENDDESVSSEVNSAKEQMEEEEGYIVNLVSQRMGNNLTTSDLPFCQSEPCFHGKLSSFTIFAHSLFSFKGIVINSTPRSW